MPGIDCTKAGSVVGEREQTAEVFVLIQLSRDEAEAAFCIAGSGDTIAIGGAETQAFLRLLR
jgi:hypothetical protein